MTMSTKTVTTTALLTALICVASPFSVYIGPIPLSFCSLAVYIAAGLTGKRLSTIAVTAYVVLGVIGVPVFAGFMGGFGRIVGPTGGFIIGYIPCAFVVGLVRDGLRGRAWSYPVAMVAGTIVLYALGTAWYVFQSGVDVAAALAACVLPFLPGDALKIAAASVLCVRLRPLVRRYMTRPAPQREEKKETHEEKK